MSSSPPSKYQSSALSQQYWHLCCHRLARIHLLALLFGSFFSLAFSLSLFWCLLWWQGAQKAFPLNHEQKKEETRIRMRAIDWIMRCMSMSKIVSMIAVTQAVATQAAAVVTQALTKPCSKITWPNTNSSSNLTELWRGRRITVRQQKPSISMTERIKQKEAPKEEA